MTDVAGDRWQIGECSVASCVDREITTPAVFKKDTVCPANSSCKFHEDIKIMDCPCDPDYERARTASARRRSLVRISSKRGLMISSKRQKPRLTNALNAPLRPLRQTANLEN